MATTCRAITGLLVIISLVGSAWGQYPTNPNELCNITTIKNPDPLFTSKILTAASVLIAQGNTTGGVTKECVNLAVSQLPVCLTDLAVIEGCCSKTCSQALNSEQTLACLPQLLSGSCKLESAGQDLTTFVNALFNTYRRCVTGKNETCMVFSPAAMMPPPEPSNSSLMSPPMLSSPELKSPQLMSPALMSPQLMSPQLASPPMASPDMQTPPPTQGSRRHLR